MTKKSRYNKVNKKNQFFKKIIFSRRVNYLIMLFIFIQVLSLNNKEKTMLDKYSYITLKINSTGNISIFHNKSIHNYDSKYTHAPEPDEIYINEVQQNEIKSFYYFNNKENSIKLVWKNEISTTCDLFYNCDKITEINLCNFNSSEVEYMAYMFDNCYSLTSLNLSNFDTSKVTSMYSMFYHCWLLASLDLYNFDTSSVETMYQMFEDCNSLTSLNLSNFDTSKVTSMHSMFDNCNSLTSLNLSNFNTSLI